MRYSWQILSPLFKKKKEESTLGKEHFEQECKPNA